MDLNVRAFRAPIDYHPAEAESKKEAAREGGLIGGPSRAGSLSAGRRREIAKEASKARWQEHSTNNNSR